MLSVIKAKAPRSEMTVVSSSGGRRLSSQISDVVSITSVTPSSGTTAGGTAVTIAVTGALGNPAVTFGGVAATSVVVANSNTITCVTGAHGAGAVDVVVGSVTSVGAYTYT